MLESKKTDALSIVAKKQAWMELADQFNAVNGVTKEVISSFVLLSTKLQNSRGPTQAGTR